MENIKVFVMANIIITDTDEYKNYEKGYQNQRRKSWDLHFRIQREIVVRMVVFLSDKT